MLESQSFVIHFEVNPSFGNVLLAKEILANLTNQKFANPKNETAISQTSFCPLANSFHHFCFETVTALTLITPPSPFHPPTPILLSFPLFFLVFLSHSCPRFPLPSFLSPLPCVFPSLVLSNGVPCAPEG